MTIPTTHSMAEVTYSGQEIFNIDNPPSVSDPYSRKLKGFGENIDNRTSYDNNEEEIYDPKKKKVKKGKSSSSVTKWLRNHYPFKCCISSKEDNSKFEFDQPNTQVYDI